MGAFANAFFPIAFGVVWCRWIDEVSKGENESPVNVYAWYISSCGAFAASIATGVLLMWSIWTIRCYLKSRNEDGSSINIRALVLHSCAFGLLTLAQILQAIAHLNWGVAFYFHQSNETRNVHAQNFFEITTINTNVCMFISEVCLCVIFVQLSKKTDDLTSRDTQTTSTDIQSIEVESFNEDDEMQARIWN